MSPILKFESLTVKDVRRVLDDAIEYHPESDSAHGSSASEYYFLTDKDPVHTSLFVSACHEKGYHGKEWYGKDGPIYFEAKDREKYTVDTCECLLRLAEDAESHVAKIDTLLSSLLNFRVHARGTQRGSFEDEFALLAYDVLRRLPSRPLSLPGAPSDIDKRYFWDDDTSVEESLGELKGSGTWGSLRVAASLSTTIIQMTLYIIISGEYVQGHLIYDYPNILAELLETCSGLASRCATNAEHQQWFVVRAALWSSWQRSVMLFLYSNLGIKLLFAMRGNDLSLDNSRLRSTKPNPGLSIHEMSALYAAKGKARSMCSWAFELLRTDDVCLGMDFRTFHRRYLQLWSRTPARCEKGSPMPCAGKDPDDCWRFKGMVIEDQSAHDSGCRRRCRKLPWDESSYRSVSGARAVMIAPENSKTGNTHLKYRSASESTLAISHVWSHGQGGRPHIGVNLCLHRRYVKIAKALGCDSYWWDSACIPEDHTLRSEAIQNINSTFSRSKVTLVCDKDLMQIDISNLTVEIEESILATILVCDWNLRAWTFLESVRGRQNIHLLCKDNRAVAFFRVVRDVFAFGSIDLAILSLTALHLFPGRVWGPEQDTDNNNSSMGIEESGQVLSYRPASRRGDDVAIWSLLTHNDGYDSIENFWRNNGSRKEVTTGFLMSSAPRLRTKGLSWAPSTPYFKPLSDSPSTGISSFRAFRGVETWPGRITDKGLLAAWHVYEFDVLDIVTDATQVCPITDNQRRVLVQICDLHLQESRWGALLLTMSGMRTFARDENTSTRYGGLIRGTLMAVLGSDSVSRPSQKPAEDRGWTWMDVFEWDEKVCLPTFVEDYDFLIE